MQSSRWLVTLFMLFAAGCSHDALTADIPELSASVYDREGYRYTDTSIDIATGALQANLGDVPVYTQKAAAYLLENKSTTTVEVRQIKVTEITGDFAPPKLFKREGNGWVMVELPHRLLPSHYLKLVQGYGPLTLGEHHTTVEIVSNAQNHPTWKATTIANAVFNGLPDIEIAYPGYTGPAIGECADNKCTVQDTNALDFGNILLGTTGTARITIRNTAECAVDPGQASTCDSCALTLQRNPSGEDIGLGFKPGSNVDGLFNFGGSTRLPANIRQKNLDPLCSASGELQLLLTFAAPSVEGTHHAVIVIESNDPDEPNIEIPVTATARNAPVAVVKFRGFDSANPSAPFSAADNLEPLTRIYFDGRDSFDPRNPTDRTLIANYTWDVISFPPGTNPADFQVQESGGFYSFWAPLAGSYTVRLIVTNVDGIPSGDTDRSTITFNVVPHSRLHVQLVWDNATSDQDLHMTHANTDDRPCIIGPDVHWRDKKPQWFTSDAAGVGPNPRLDKDDTNGYGPENINIDQPKPGTYRIYVHYFAGSGNIRQTVRVWLNGLPVAEYRRTLRSSADTWAVADVTWLADATGVVTPIPSDTAGEVGSVRNISDCSALNGGGLF